MKANIGAKIKAIRMEKNLTQEEIAEILGVSRQTISNWETGRSYPDIISLLKMSDYYQVSLDYLLKGEETMGDYYEYLEESTNVVKSNIRKKQLATIQVYLLIWAMTLISFWFLNAGEDPMIFSILYLWILLPITTLVVSLMIGGNNFFGKSKWALSPFFGLMYMIGEYGTFSLANTLAFGRINPPEWGMFVTGSLLSLVGMATGYLFYWFKGRKEKRIESRNLKSS